MASIQKRPGRHGAVRYRVQMRLQGRAISSTFATKAAARQWATQVESGILRTHRTSAVVQVTLEELLQRYRREVLPHKRRGTQANQAHHLDWWTEALGLWPIADVTLARLGACYRNSAAGRDCSHFGIGYCLLYDMAFIMPTMEQQRD